MARVRTKLSDRSRAAGKRARDLNAKLRTRSAAARDEALAIVRHKNLELGDLAETAATEAQRLLANAKRAITAKPSQRRRRQPSSRPRGRSAAAAGWSGP